MARSGVDRVEIRLPGRTDGITVTVRADGYVPWGQGLRYKLDHSRVLYLQAELTPVATLLPPPVGEGWGGGSQSTKTPASVLMFPTSTTAPNVEPQAVIAPASPMPALPTDTLIPTVTPNPSKNTVKEPTPTTTPTPPTSPVLSPHPLTPTPSPYPLTPTPSVPSVDSWWAWPCNTPCREFPDGCEYEHAVEPPDHPLVPPCIRTAYTRTVPNDAYPELLDIELIVVVDHPEYSHYLPHRDAQFVRLVLQPAYGGWYTDHWQLREPDWWFKCDFDEAPLAWALTEALNTRSFAPFGVAYEAPSPAPFFDFIVGLIEAEEPTATSTPKSTDTPTSMATLMPEPTIDSPLPTPIP